MENVYTLSGRYAEISDRYEELAAQLDDIFEENGGVETDETRQILELQEEQDRLRREVLRDIVDHADDYAAIAMNKAAQRKVLEAELKAIKEEQAKVVAKYQARINGVARCEEFWKENFKEAMNIEKLTKIGGPRTGHKFTVWVKESQSVEVDEPAVLAPYQDTIDELVSRLPGWVTVKTSVSKSELKKEETLPTGAALVTSTSVQIR